MEKYGTPLRSPMLSPSALALSMMPSSSGVRRLSSAAIEAVSLASTPQFSGIAGVPDSHKGRASRSSSRPSSSLAHEYKAPLSPLSARVQVQLEPIRSAEDLAHHMSIDDTLDVPRCDACPQCDDTCDVPDCADCKLKRDAILSRANKCKNRVYTMCQVQRHNTPDDCWIANEDSVFDAGAFANSGKHPGGSRSILRKAGQDCSADFEFHSKDGRAFVLV